MTTSKFNNREINFPFINIQECGEFQEKLIFDFLNKTFDDLIYRTECLQVEQKFISKEILASYLDLPIMLTRRLIKIFKGNKSIDKGNLNKEDFVKGIYDLYFSDLETILELTFKIFNIDKKQIISFEDVKLLISTLNTGEILINDYDKILINFFGENQKLSKIEYYCKIKNENSDLLLIFLILIYSRQPFTEDSILFFQNISQIENEELILNKENNKNFKIFRPSTELNFYLKLVGKNKLGPSRKKGNKKINLFNNIEKNSENNLLDNFITFKINDQINNFVENENCLDNDNNENITAPNTRIGSLSHKNMSKIKNENNFSTFTIFAYKMNKDNKLRKYKISLIDKTIFQFKYCSNLKEFIFDRIIPLKGYFITKSNTTKLEIAEFHTIVLIANYGNTMANLENIFFIENQNDAIELLNKLKTLLNIKDINDDFLFIRELGKGQYGKVLLGKHKITGEKVAIKIIKKSKLKETEMKIIRNEIDIMKFLKFNNHPNIVKTYDIFEDKSHIYFVMEFLDAGCLTNFLNSIPSLLRPNEIKLISLQILEGLNFLHKSGIVHRDLKTDNIMLNSDKINNIKIVDFGLSKFLFKNEYTNEGFGTLVYSSPEILKKTPYNNKVDVWSFGVLIFYISTGIFPFNGKGINNSEIANKICNDDFNFPQKMYLSREIIKLILICLEKNQDFRLSIEQILNLEIL